MATAKQGNENVASPQLNYADAGFHQDITLPSNPILFFYEKQTNGQRLNLLPKPPTAIGLTGMANHIRLSLHHIPRNLDHFRRHKYRRPND